jgi:hypothetical protein
MVVPSSAAGHFAIREFLGDNSAGGKNSTDVDMYELSVGPGSHRVVAQTSLADLGSVLLGVTLRLYDGASKELMTVQGAQGSPTRLGFSLPFGGSDYYLAVSGENNNNYNPVSGGPNNKNGTASNDGFYVLNIDVSTDFHWSEQGPTFINNGQVVLAGSGSQTAGAVAAIATHPTNKDIVYIAAVNGGIWKTENATASNPSWTPLTDSQSSLSIASLAFDLSDPTYQTLVAGIGRVSNANRDGGALGGILRTTDGGTTWTRLDGGGNLSAVNVVAVQARGTTLLAAGVADPDHPVGRGGLWRSINGGMTFSRIDGPGSPSNVFTSDRVYDLIADPKNLNNFYLSSEQGIYFSTAANAQNAGAVWSNLLGGRVDIIRQATVANVKLALHSTDDPNDRALYAAVADEFNGKKRLTGVFRLPEPDQVGQVWVSLGVPETVETWGGAIVSASDTPSIVIATANLDGLSNGQLVRISGVTGNTAANGVRTVEIVGTDGKHFALKSTDAVPSDIAGNGAFTGAGTWTAGVIQYETSQNGEIVITSKAHGQSSGDYVQITGARGDVNANNDPNNSSKWRITVLNANQFELDNSNGDATDLYIESSGTWHAVQGINPGGQAGINLSLAADPTDPDIFYIGGDVQPLSGGARAGGIPNSVGAGRVGPDSLPTGRLFWGKFIANAQTRFTSLTHDFADSDGPGPLPGTAPHADSRAIAFTADGTLLEADDGGIYIRQNRTGSNGVWASENGGSVASGLDVEEFRSLAYDPVSDVLIGGAQDIGSLQQDGPFALHWSAVLGGDGAVVQSGREDVNANWHYEATQNFNTLRRAEFKDSGDSVTDANGNPVSSNARLQVLGTTETLANYEYDNKNKAKLPFATQYALNAITPSHLLIGTNAGIYESTDRGDTLTDITGSVLPGLFGPVSAIAYGGRSKTTGDNPSLAIVVSSANRHILVRGAFMFEPVTFYNIPGFLQNVVNVVLDPTEWRNFYLLDDHGHVWQAKIVTPPTVPPLAIFTDITGNLSQISGQKVRSITFVPGTDSNVLMVGADNGVFAAQLTRPDLAPLWVQVGDNLAHAPVTDLRYAGTIYTGGVPSGMSDTLTAGTLGRGAWKLKTVAPNYDTAAPSVTAIDLLDSPTEALPAAHFRVTFSEPVVNVPAGNFTTMFMDKNGVASPSAHVSAVTFVDGENGTQWDVTVGFGDDFYDFNGLPLAGGTFSIKLVADDTHPSHIYDTAGNQLKVPAVSGVYTISQPTNYLLDLYNTSTFTNGTTVWIADFGQAVPNGLSAANFAFSGSAAAGATITGFGAGSGLYPLGWSVGIEVSTTTEGSLTLSMVNSSGLNDGAMPPNPITIGNLPFAGNAVTVDTTAPMATDFVHAGNAKTTSSIVFWALDFSEPVAGLTVGDFATTGPPSAKVTDVTAPGPYSSSWTVAVYAGTGDGTLSVSLTGASATDAAGNHVTGLPFGSDSILIDHTPPTITSFTLLDPNPSPSGLVSWQIMFSEPVLGLSDQNFALTGAVPDQPTDDEADSSSGLDVVGEGAVWTVTTQTGDAGLLGLDLSNSNDVSDMAGNAIAMLPASGPSYTIDDSPPDVSLAVPLSGVFTPGGTGYPVTIKVTDDLAVKASSLGANNLRITGPNGFNSLIPFSFTDGPDGTPRLATYSFAPPGGSWDLVDNGTYSVSVEPNQITDTAGNAADPAVLGTFKVFVPGDTTPPTVTLTSPLSDVTVAGGAGYQVLATASDNVSVNVSSLDSNDLRVTGPNGFNELIPFVSVNLNYDGTPRLATYAFTPPGGFWDSADNGTYTVSLEANQVSDTSGNFAAAEQLGTFTVNIPGDSSPPTVSLTSALTDVTVAGGTAYSVSVTISDNVAVRVASLNGNDLRVTGPNGFSVLMPITSVDVAGDGSPRVATYSFLPPGGTWDAADNGTYTVSVEPGQITDTSGNAAAAPTLGTFQVTLSDTTVPTAIAELDDVTIPGGMIYKIQVVYEDDGGIDVSTLGSSNITITGPLGSIPVIFTGVDVGTNGAPRVATYEFPAPGGKWNFVDNGLYTVSMNAGTVFDTAMPMPHSVAAGIIGTFSVSLPIVVDTPFDEVDPLDGKTSLREAITLANATAGANTITFDPMIFAGPMTIPITMGEMKISDSVTIVGPGSKLLTLDAMFGSRFFNIDDGKVGNTIDVSISGMTLMNGKKMGTTSAGRGGAIILNDDTLDLSDCKLIHNAAEAEGGAIAVTLGAGVLNISDSYLFGNSSTGAVAAHVGSGGAIAQSAASSVTLTRTAVSGNDATNNGGGLYLYSGGSLLVTDSLISSNTAMAGMGGGGGIFFSGTPSGTGFDIRNSTISGNFAMSPLGSGGGIGLSAFSGLLTVENSTLTMNSTAMKGGGIARTSGTGTVTLQSTIVGGNSTMIFPDPTSDLEFSTPTAVGGDNNLIGVIDPINNVVLTGSGNLTGSAMMPLIPGLLPLADNGGPTFTHALMPSSPAIDHGNNEAGLANDQRGPGFPRIANGFADIGAYEFSSYFVFNTNDAGLGSLRQAILNANTSPTSHTITFDSTVFSTPQTISLTSGELLITGPTTITGPGNNLLTVSRSATAATLFRIFEVNGPGVFDVTISGLTISGGNTEGNGATNGGGTKGDGAGLLLYDQNVNLLNVSVSGNTSGSEGGGIAVAPVNLGGAGSLTIRNSTISGNVANGVPYGFGGAGGGIYFAGDGTLLLESSTVSGNTSTYGEGGGIYLYAEDTVLSTFTIRNSTIASNHAVHNGAGVIFVTAGNSASNSLAIQNSTIANNVSSAGAGGGIARLGSAGTVTLTSTIVANNISPTSPDVDGTVTANYCLIRDQSGATISGANNLPTGTDPLLGPLGDHGGPTLTMALLPGSPAINAGSNPAALTNDQRGAGFARVNGGAIDIGAFESNLPPTVRKVTINGGAAQRSRVTSVTVDFDSVVTFSGSPVSAFTLTRQSDNATPMLSAAVTNGAVTSVTLTFLAGAAVDYGSLADGRYTLTIDQSQVSANGAQLDGNGDGVGGDNYVLASAAAPNPPTNIFRIYGDVNGDGTVAASDFIVFRQYFGGYLFALDFDGDGAVAASDFIQFRLRFGGSI